MSGKTPKILYIASTFSHLKAFHQPYLRWFAEGGCTVHAAAGGEAAALDGVARTIRLPFEKKMFSPRNLEAVKELSALLREEDYGLISLHTSLAAFFGRLAVKRAGKGDTVVMNTVHGYLFDENTPWAKRQLLLGAERLTAGVTDYLLTMNRRDDAIARQYALGREIVFTPGMGVDLAHFQPAATAQRLAARAELGLPQDALVLLYAAEFSPRKNQRLLLEALPDLPRDTWLLLPGRGEQLESCKALARRLGVAGRVVFPGFVSDVARCCHAADLCVSPSRSEGLPFNVVEAMSCALPVIATDVKGHQELVRPGRTGLLFPFGDRQALVAAVNELSALEARAPLGQAARLAAEEFGLVQVFPRLTHLYAQALNGRTAALV